MQVIDTSALASFLNREAPSILCTLNAQDTLTFFLPCSRLVYRLIYASMLTKPPVVGDLDILLSGGTAAWWVQDSYLEEVIVNFLYVFLGYLTFSALPTIKIIPNLQLLQRTF